MIRLLAAAALAADTPPPEKPPAPVVKVGGLIFAYYDYSLTEGSRGYNEFGLDRAYLIVRATLSDHLATRLTIDADHLKPIEQEDGSELTIDTKYRVFVKHAYLEGRWEELGLRVRGGIVNTPYAPLYSDHVGIRYIAQAFAKANKLLDSADLGIGVNGRHAGGLLDWNLSLLNGEGYSKLEVDGGKAVQARVTVDPLAPGGELNLPIIGFVSVSDQPSTDTATVTYAGALGFKHSHFVAWGEYLGVQRDGVQSFGFSGTVLPRHPEVGGVLFRIDSLDPDIRTDDDAGTSIICGLTHDFYEKVSLAITYERAMQESAPDAPVHDVVLHMQAGF